MSDTVSVDLAKRLCDAGLQHEPQDWDTYWLEEQGGPFVVSKGAHLEEGDVWLPTLDDCLGEIERRGYFADLECREESYKCTVFGPFGKGWRDEPPEDIGKRVRWHHETGKRRPDATALALLWIVEREATSHL